MALSSTFFATFYVNNVYLASEDAGFLQHALTHLVNLFQRVGLRTITSKTQTMIICTPGWIWTHLPTESYCRMQCSMVTAAKWNSRNVQCHQCRKGMKAGSLGCHLADVHDIYQQTVVTKDPLEDQPPPTYTASMGLHGSNQPCPFPGWKGQLQDGWMMRRHFRDVHPLDLVVVPKEGKYDQCEWCGMQVNPLYLCLCHRFSKECQVGVKRKKQWEVAVTLALALQQQFRDNGEVLEWVEDFKYLGRLLAQDDDDIQAIHAQLQKARATWAQVGQVLRSKNAIPHVAVTFYKAIVQAILLYGCEAWVLSWTALARLEGFHIHAAYRMAKMHKLKRGPGRTWIYPRLLDVLQECGLKTMEEYIGIRWQMIAVYVATCPILNKCR